MLRNIGRTLYVGHTLESPTQELTNDYSVILDASLVVSAGGVRVLSQVLYEGPYELSETLAMAFLYLLDMPATRKYIRAGHDMEVSASLSYFLLPGILYLRISIHRLSFRRLQIPSRRSTWKKG